MSDAAAASNQQAVRHALKDGDTFLVCDARGDIVDSHGDGLYRDGTRVLSRLRLRLGDTEPSLLSAGVGGDNVLLTVHLTNRPLPPLGDTAPAEGVIHVERTRFLWDARMYERITCRNYGEAPLRFAIGLEFGADFHDMFEVRGARRNGRGQQLPPALSAQAANLSYVGLDGQMRQLCLSFSQPPQVLIADRADFQLELPPGGSHTLYLEAGADPAQPDRARFRRAAAAALHAMRRRRRTGAQPRSSNRLFNAWLQRSRADIALLTSDLPTGPYPYAGIPWFSTPFGRDAVITALQTLWLDPSLARGVLAYLAQHQARETSAFRDSTPGKIMHESRKGEMVALQELPFGLYYGGVDTTPLFLMLAGAYAERSGDQAFVDQLWPSLTAAAGWIERSCDADRDGLLAYHRGEPGGLLNQGWKDSGDSVFHEDGTIPPGPIALVEVQGYACAGLEALAALADARGAHADAARWNARAQALREKIETLFWDPALNFYAIARDGEGRRCRVRASNAGHLLFAGATSAEHARAVAAQLGSPAFDGGWGVRTLASGQARYNPMSYHDGSVWPHDVALCAAGIARYGERLDAARLLTELFEAAAHFGMRLPELFCGFPRSPGQAPIAYPVACLPQAWAAGSVFMLLQACLGVRIDAARGEVHVDRPCLPDGVNRLQLQRLRVGERQVDLSFERVGERIVVARGAGSDTVRIDVRL
ncbi:amylo-alpha-1,6-glucosidase [Xanthomonas sp. AmX2]|uniref:amylo-alpha-1,6-glucosidase n=1 Tax=Xanthomonas sp. TaxID=29446 RepID=UPI00197F013B|nr:amylo-alpha-1,6-glucosidase [Xanthomonas sp.]MBN6149962.1 amylo-alpha-1,6-glucosidase [Xanthomonas sp.]